MNPRAVECPSSELCALLCSLFFLQSSHSPFVSAIFPHAHLRWSRARCDVVGESESAKRDCAVDRVCEPLSSWQWIARAYLLSEIDELFAVRRKNGAHLIDEGAHEKSRPLGYGFERKKIVA